MSREKQLVKNTLILSVGNFLPKLVSIITLPIITAFLTKSELGTYDLLSTLVALVIPVSTLQIQSAAFRFLIDCRDNQEQTGKVISSIILFCAPIQIITSVIIGIVCPIADTGLRCLISGFFFLDGVTTISGQIVRGIGHNKFYSISSIISAVINGICIVLAVQNARLGLTGVIISHIISSSISIGYLFIRAKIHRHIRLCYFSKDAVKELLAYSWPMIPNNLSNWVLSLSDRLIITGFLGIEANAVYSVANRIPRIVILGQSVFMMAWQENASLAVNDQDAESYYSKLFDTMWSVMIGFTAILIGFTPYIFKLLIKGDYSDSYFQIPILFLGVFFSCMSSFQGGLYIAHKKTKSVGITTIIAAGINLLVDFLLINHIGITAGSVSTLVAYFSLFIFRLKDTLKFQRLKYNNKKMIVSILILVAMLLICIAQNTYLNIFNAFLGLSVLIVFNREMIKMVLQKIRKQRGPVS